MPNSSGLLPNDRTHVLKLFGAYRFGFGLAAGTYFTVQSGTPLNEFGPSSDGGTDLPIFLVERGSAGRTPTLWDLNLRLVYQASQLRIPARVTLDLLHVGNPQAVANQEQIRLIGFDMSPNPTFGRPLTHQPPMTVRLGVEVGLQSEPR